MTHEEQPPTPAAQPGTPMPTPLPADPLLDGGQLGSGAINKSADTEFVAPPEKKKRGFHPALVLATVLVVLGIIYAFPVLLMWVCGIAR